MEVFNTVIRKDESGRLTVIEIPFDPRKIFPRPKGTIFVHGTINGTEYRSKLLSRGGGRFLLILDKDLQKRVRFDGTILNAHVTMAMDEIAADSNKESEPVTLSCEMDVLTAIRTRRSIRKFTGEPVSEDLLDTILSAGLNAPTAKNKRPFHFVVIRNHEVLTELAGDNSNTGMLGSAPCAIAICGDRNIEGMKEFLYADCAAAAQNMLLAIHGLGLGGVWCGVAANSDWRKLLIERLTLPLKMEPVSVIAFGWPDESKELCSRREPGKIHFDSW